MQHIDFWPTFSAVVYFLGMILHYYHVLTVFYLQDIPDEERSKIRTMMFSLIWPWTVILMTTGLMGDGDDD